MSKVITQNDSNVEQPDNKEEEGGIVTTVKAQDSKDLDFVARLKELNGEEEEKPETETPVDDKKPKVAAVPKTDDDEEDWQAGLSPKAKAEVNRLYKENRRTRRDLKEQSDRLAALETRIAGNVEHRAPTPVAAAAELVRPVKPDPLNFKDQKEFDAAELKYEDDVYDYRRALDAKKEAEARQAESARQTISRFNGLVDKFTEIHTDYAEVMDDADNEVSDLMFGAIIDEGPALGYYFATHPDESAKIARMSNEKEAIKAIMKVVVKLEETPPKPKPAATTVVPKKEKEEEPPRQVSGRIVTTIQQKDRSKMSFKEKEREYAKKHPGALNYEP